MPVPTYTDLFNEAMDDLATALNAVTGLTCITDPRNLVPPCALIEAPSFVAWNFNIVKITYPVRIITVGPGNLDAQKSLMSLAAKVLNANVGVVDGRPTIAVIGGSELPAYDLTIERQAQTG